MPSRLGEVWKWRRQRTATLRQAIDTVRAESKGQSKQRARELLMAHLDNLNLTPPVSDTTLDTMTEAIVSGDNTIEKGWLAARIVANTLGKGARAVNEIRTQVRPGSTDMGLEGEPIMIRFDRSQPPLLMRLDPGVQEWLSEVTDQKVVTSIAGPREIFVLLGKDDGSDSGLVSVTVGSRRIGTLNRSDGRLFSQILAVGAEQGRPVVGQATQELEVSGLWQVRVYCPSSERS